MMPPAWPPGLPQTFLPRRGPGSGCNGGGAMNFQPFGWNHLRVAASMLNRSIFLPMAPPSQRCCTARLTNALRRRCIAICFAATARLPGSRIGQQFALPIVVRDSITLACWAIWCPSAITPGFTRNVLKGFFSICYGLASRKNFRWRHSSPGVEAWISTHCATCIPPHRYCCHACQGNNCGRKAYITVSYA